MICRAVSIVFVLLLEMSANAGIVFNTNGLSGGTRWDAAPRVISGEERSLQGGLRFSVQGGSYEAFRDRFTWNSAPSVAQFQQAVETAFAAWSSVDPVSNLGTSISFGADFGTAVQGTGVFGSLNTFGAEIDLFGLDAGDAGVRAFTMLNAIGSPVTLTSGTANYAGTSAISGVDVHINNNAGAVYTLDTFRRLLTHELGHSLGFADVEFGGAFIDDNFSVLNPSATLNNSWAHLVNPLDPANSAGLSTFSINGATFSQGGIDLLMESNGLGIGPSNPLSNLIPLTNDEYGTRQFLYPTLSAVPEPSSFALVGAGIIIAWRVRRKRTSA